MLDSRSKSLHQNAVLKAQRYLLAEAELLSAIIEIDRLRVYEKFGETHLSPYCVKYLNLSPDVAGLFVRVARKSQQIPDLEIAVQEGLQISKAKTIAAVLTPENAETWIEKAKTLSKEKLEREVAVVNPAAVKPEKAKPVTAELVRIEAYVTHEEYEMIQRARELCSQKLKKQAGLGETWVVATRDWLDREDPIRKAERSRDRMARVSIQNSEAQSKSGSRAVRSVSHHSRVRNEQSTQGASSGKNAYDHLEEPVKFASDRSRDRSEIKQMVAPTSAATQDQSLARQSQRAELASPGNECKISENFPAKNDRSISKTKRTPLPAGVIHQVNLRDRGACRKRMADGHNCGSRLWVELHHVVPKAQGGEDTVENLITLCSAHHRQLHQTFR